jgi:hypothetical protein
LSVLHHLIFIYIYIHIYTVCGIYTYILYLSYPSSLSLIFMTVRIIRQLCKVKGKVYPIQATKGLEGE